MVGVDREGVLRTDTGALDGNSVENGKTGSLKMEVINC